MCGLSLVAVSGGLFTGGAQASNCGGSSGGKARALGHVGFSTCDTWAELPSGM